MKKIILIFISCMYGVSCFADFTQAIIPMAGLGTRLLPLTKSVSKSMMPLIDKPALQHVVEEALQSQINDFCFIVNGHEQEAIEHYFSQDLVLDAILKERKKMYLVEHLNEVIAQTHFTYIMQPEPLGLGHAVLMGQPFIQPGSFFSVMLPDNIIESSDPHMAHLIEIAQQYNASVITIEEISREKASQYAVVTPKEFLTDDLIDVADIVEKPTSLETTLCFGQIGRCVLSYDIFEALQAIEPGVGGEIQLTDAVRYLLQQGKRVLAYKLHGVRHDIGNVRGLLRTAVISGLHNPLYRDMLLNIFNQEIFSKG